MLEKINNRLDKAIANLEIDNFEKLFPIMLDDLEYVLVGIKEDEKQLSSTERFMSGVSLTSKIYNYLAKLASLYFKLLYDINIEIIDSDDYNLSIAAGGYNSEDDKIYYSYLGAMLSKTSDLSFLHTCLHEGRHKMQHDAYQKEDILAFQPYMLRLLKENLLEESLQENNRKFYLDNYKKLFTENDAEYFAKQEINSFIQKLMSVYLKVTNKNQTDIDNELMYKISKINHLFNTILKEEKFNIVEEVIIQTYDAALITDKLIIKEERVDRLTALDKHIKNNPELQEEYPILRLLFNGTTPKNHQEIIADLMKLKEGKTLAEKEKIDSLYDEIIATDPILLLSEILLSGNMSAVEMFMNMYPTIAIEYKDEIKELNEQYGCFNSYIK